MTDGLKVKYRAAIISILSANERVERAVLFGSRAMETFTPASDIDISPRFPTSSPIASHVAPASANLQFKT